MSNETFYWIPVAITLLLAVWFLWWVVALATEMKRRFWYLPAGAVVGAIIGVIVGGYVCQPWTLVGGLFGVVFGAAASSWRRSRQNRLNAFDPQALSPLPIAQNRDSTSCTTVNPPLE
jgi:hypothetical protein